MNNRPINAEKVDINFYKIYKVFDKSTGKYLSSAQKNIWDGVGGVKQMIKAKFHNYKGFIIPDSVFIQ